MDMEHHKTATPRCSNRLFEWVSAVMMAQIGLTVLVSELFIHARPQLAFEALTDIGLSVVQVGVIFSLFGILRIVALRLNGQWLIGPHIRVICAIVGIMIWGQLFYGIIHVYMKTGEVYLSFGVWDALLFGEYVSIKRAVLDIKSPTVEARAVT